MFRRGSKVTGIDQNEVAAFDRIHAEGRRPIVDAFDEPDAEALRHAGVRALHALLEVLSLREDPDELLAALQIEGQVAINGLPGGNLALAEVSEGCGFGRARPCPPPVKLRLGERQ